MSNIACNDRIILQNSATAIATSLLKISKFKTKNLENCLKYEKNFLRILSSFLEFYIVFKTRKHLTKMTKTRN